MKKVIAFVVLLLILVCLGLVVNCHIHHDQADFDKLPRWSGYLFLGMFLLIAWPHMTKDEELF